MKRLCGSSIFASNPDSGPNSLCRSSHCSVSVSRSRMLICGIDAVMAWSISVRFGGSGSLPGL
jgi:hypothetical protein